MLGSLLEVPASIPNRAQIHLRERSAPAHSRLSSDTFDGIAGRFTQTFVAPISAEPMRRIEAVELFSGPRQPYATRWRGDRKHAWPVMKSTYADSSADIVARKSGAR